MSEKDIKKVIICSIKSKICHDHTYWVIAQKSLNLVEFESRKPYDISCQLNEIVHQTWADIAKYGLGVQKKFLSQLSTVSTN